MLGQRIDYQLRFLELYPGWLYGPPTAAFIHWCRENRVWPWTIFFPWPGINPARKS